MSLLDQRHSETYNICLDQMRALSQQHLWGDNTRELTGHILPSHSPINPEQRKRIAMSMLFNQKHGQSSDMPRLQRETSGMNSVTPAVKKMRMYRTTKTGDTLKAIAKRFGCHDMEMLACNKHRISGLSMDALLMKGTNLVCPPPDNLIFKAHENDTIRNLAKRFGFDKEVRFPSIIRLFVRFIQIISLKP